MDSLISTDPKSERRRACLSLLGLVPPAASLVLFTLARHTVLLPPNRVVPLFMKSTIVEMIAAGLFTPLAVIGLAVCHKILFERILWSAVSSTLAPLCLLLLYPLRVFVLHRLSVPAPISVLMTPRPLLWLAFSLCAFEFLRPTLLSARLELWLFSRFREKSPLLVATMLFVAVLVVFGAVTCHNNRGEMLVGDEPHYLFVMQSLKQFHTAELTHLLKLPEEELPPGIVRVKPHKSRQSVEGRTYSIHNIGLPLLMVIPHAVAGLHGVMLLFSVVTALLVANVFLLALEITGRKWMSVLVATLVGLSCPFAFYFRCIYPDVVAALLVVYAFRIVRKKSPHLATVFLAGAAAAFLPWLHARYVLFAATLFVGAAVALRCNPLKLGAFAAPFLVSAPLLIWFFYTAYGSWLPSAQYGTDSPPVSRFLWRGAPGAFFDRNHGILAFAPVYFLAAAGLAPLVRGHRRDSILIGILTLPSFVAFSSHWMWWGGPCPPGRFIMPLLPFTAPMIVLALVRMNNPVCRTAAAAAAAMGIGIFLLSIRFTDMLTTHKHIFSYCSTAWNAFPCLPNFFIHRRDPMPLASPALLSCWLIPVAFLFCYGMIWRKSRVERRSNAVHPPTSECAALEDRATAEALESGGPPPHPPAARFLPIAILAAFVAFPGLAAYVANTYGEPRPVALFNHQIGEYAQPLLRSGIDPRTYNSPTGPHQLLVLLPRKHPITLELTDSETVETKSVETRFMDVLYPVPYEFECGMKAPWNRRRETGRVAIMTHKGEPVASADLPISRPFGRVRLTFAPSAVLPQTRIRCTLTSPDSLELGRLYVRAYLGQAVQK